PSRLAPRAARSGHGTPASRVFRRFANDTLAPAPAIPVATPAAWREAICRDNAPRAAADQPSRRPQSDRRADLTAGLIVCATEDHRSRSWHVLLGPDSADQAELARDGAWSAIQQRGDFIDGITFPFPDRDRPQLGIFQAVEETLDLLLG